MGHGEPNILGGGDGQKLLDIARILRSLEGYMCMLKSVFAIGPDFTEFAHSIKHHNTC